MKRWFVVLTVLMATMLAIACSKKSSEKVEEEDVQTPAEETEKPAELDPVALDSVVVSTEWLEPFIDHPQVLTIHVGTDHDAWAKAHIPGQAFVPFSQIVVGSMELGFELPEMDKLRDIFEAAGVDDDKVVVLTGDMEGLHAARAFYSLEVLGLAGNVAVLGGGLEQWKKEDRAISSDVKTQESGSITATPDTSMIVDAAQVTEMLGDSEYQLVDARPAAEFSGKTPGQSIERGGHIPGAVNVFWKDTLTKKDRPLLMPLDEIKSLYAEAGVSDDATIVAYCRTGVQASFGYLVGRMQDRDVLIYDGSYKDWSSDAERPIEN